MDDEQGNRIRSRAAFVDKMNRRVLNERCKVFEPDAIVITMWSDKCPGTKVLWGTKYALVQVRFELSDVERLELGLSLLEPIELHA